MARRNKRGGRRSRRRNANGKNAKNFSPLIPMLAPLVAPLLKPLAEGIGKRIGGGRKANRATLRKNGMMGAAAVQASRSSFKTWSDGTDMHVSGCDLVRPVPQALVNYANGIDDLFSVIPCNPAYWTGTRIAQLAPGYQQYRPLQFSYEYVPQVAVTQQGTVTMGTLWDTSVSSEDLQQTLVTSNGGQIVQCYNATRGNVVLGSNLQYNLYELSGFLDQTTNPFVFVAGSQATGVVPGYFMITYHYVFKNPIGSSWSFSVDWDAQLKSEYSDAYVSAISLHQSAHWGPGTVFTFNGGEWTRNGQPLDDAADIRAAVFTSNPADVGIGVDPDPTPTGLELTAVQLRNADTAIRRYPTSWPTTSQGKVGFISMSPRSWHVTAQYRFSLDDVNRPVVNQFLTNQSAEKAFYIIYAFQLKLVDMNGYTIGWRTVVSYPIHYNQGTSFNVDAATISNYRIPEGTTIAMAYVHFYTLSSEELDQAYPYMTYEPEKWYGTERHTIVQSGASEVSSMECLPVTTFYSSQCFHNSAPVNPVTVSNGTDKITTWTPQKDREWPDESIPNVGKSRNVRKVVA